VLIVLSYRDEALDAAIPSRVMLGEWQSGVAPTRFESGRSLRRLSLNSPSPSTSTPASSIESRRQPVFSSSPRCSPLGRPIPSSSGTLCSPVRRGSLAGREHCSTRSRSTNARGVVAAQALAASTRPARRMLGLGMLVERRGRSSFVTSSRACDRGVAGRPRRGSRCTGQRWKRRRACCRQPISAGSPTTPRQPEIRQPSSSTRRRSGRAAAVGAHREAQAQYARALRHGGDVSPEARAARSSCSPARTADRDARTRHRGVRRRRSRSDGARRSAVQGRTLRLLARYLVASVGSRRLGATEDAIAVLEGPPRAGARSSVRRSAGFRWRRASWTRRSCGITRDRAAERVGDTEALVNALNSVGVSRRRARRRVGRIDAVSSWPRRGMATDVAPPYTISRGRNTAQHWELADRYIAPGIEYCGETVSRPG